MKTKINIFRFCLTLIALAAFFSCENPTSLGSRLDLLGPVVTIVSPTQRQSMPEKFDLEGTVEDYSGVDRMIVTAVTNNDDFPRQWRYQKGAWEVSGDYGATWSPLANAVWSGKNTSIIWKIPIDMGKIEEGEYTFNVQAWDKGNFSDDNSFKALVLIIDPNPPKVVIIDPYIYKGKDAYESSPLKELHDIPDTSDEWKSTANLGKFITQEFDLKWQIEDTSDVWSFDLRFYPYDIVIDNDPDTGLPDSYIYKYTKNLPPPAPAQDPVNPNGSVKVPALNNGIGYYDDDGEIKNPIDEKTTVKIVAVCYDMAGNANQEKTLGYFIYWPKANTPWIVFTDGMREFKDYSDDLSLANIDADVFMVYPGGGKKVKATAFQAHGVKEVKYVIYKCDTSNDELHYDDNSEIIKQGTLENPPRSSGVYSNIFPWEFDVPSTTGYYVVKAQAFSSQGVPGEEYEMLFKVHDITLPDFPEPPKPDASDPLFMTMVNNKITISGIVRDATEVKTLCMVWINPESENFAAMSQLAYFRDKDYNGWKEALLLDSGTSGKEGQKISTGSYPYDPNEPNRLWKLSLTDKGLDSENRKCFEYSQVIDLDDLNIGMGKQPLKSQIFLLRAENPSEKCTIITYAPQGDTLPPEIEITDVAVNGGTPPYIPREYSQIPKFNDTDTITINGIWKEDSVEFLDIDKYFLPNFEITVNNQKIITVPDIYDIPVTVKNKLWDGRWTLEIKVGVDIPVDKLKDSLVIGVNVKDIGGNVAQDGASWLIESDNLRLLRISSEEEDSTYSVGQEIEIFMEFSKPVNLNPNSGTPVLLLSSTGTGAAAKAVYRTTPAQNNQNSRQYFVYTVGDNHTAEGASYLNVIGLENAPPSSFSSDTYPFIWYRGEGNEKEEVRITMDAGYDGTDLQQPGGYYVRTLPTAGNDYQFTLAAGKHINIDTIRPEISSITTSSDGYYRSGDIYITVTFSEPVAIPSVPRLTLQITNGTTSAEGKKTDAADVRVNDNKIIFKYSIKDGDTTNGIEVDVTGYEDEGTITDLAGNDFTGTINGTLTGVYIETLKPPAPTVRILPVNTTANDDNVVINNVNNTDKKGTSTDGEKHLSNLYNNDLWLAIEGTDRGTYKLNTLEYSINNGISWVSFTKPDNTPNLDNTPVSLTQTGSYQIIARQIDEAGNVSLSTPAITFFWNPGALVSRISSTSANGTYTHVAGRNVIEITVHFRESLYFTETPTPPSITLNAQRYGSDITVSTTAVSNANSLTFTYTVQNGDSIPGNSPLQVKGLSVSASDKISTDTTRVNVSDYIFLPSGGLDSSKEFYVATGNLSTTSDPAFIDDADGGTGWDTETNSNFHGIRSDDGSYWTTLEIVFNHNVLKGSGNIKIEQDSTGYRLPAVLTEAQYNRFRSVSDFSVYYFKGTNGYINGTGSDTSTKYVLQYNYDPNGTFTTNPGFTENTSIPDTFYNDFRDKEAITIPVNAQAVTIDASTLSVRLSGSNAPQVPGANYTVTIPAGFVIDDLGNSWPASQTTYNVNLRGVAKPFVRIRKSQDTIATGTGSANNPRLVATQPLTTQARIDCRTPGSDITYTSTTATSNVTVNNWSTGVVNPPNNNTVGDAATRPGNANTSSYTDSNQILIGDSNYQAFQWWTRARAGKGGVYSSETEEIAYRTVITYQLNNGGNAITAQTGEQILGSGDQIWIRGGDAIGSSSIPGFPLTWEDNWNNLSGKRAGIRLMSKTDTTSSLNNSEWKFVTWEINATAYVDFIMGRDDATDNSTAAQAWQYGPRRWAYQRAGWTSFKTSYPIYPGKHRWCNAGQDHAGKGAINFSGTFSQRDNKATDYGTGLNIN